MVAYVASTEPLQVLAPMIAVFPPTCKIERQE